MESTATLTDTTPNAGEVVQIPLVPVVEAAPSIPSVSAGLRLVRQDLQKQGRIGPSPTKLQSPTRRHPGSGRSSCSCYCCRVFRATIAAA